MKIGRWKLQDETARIFFTFNSSFRSSNIWISYIHNFKTKYVTYTNNINNNKTLLLIPISHFRVVLSLPIKARLGANHFIWKLVLFAREWKLMFIRKVVHLGSLWPRGLKEFENSLLIYRRSILIWHKETAVNLVVAVYVK